MLRAADRSFPFWVALQEEKCTGENYHKLRNFCQERDLSLSRHGHSLNSEGQFFQVFMFGQEDDAEVFRKEFGGVRMNPAEKGRGHRWSRWKRDKEKAKSV